MVQPQKRSIIIPSPKKLEEGQKRLSKDIKESDIDSLSHRVMPGIASVLGAESVSLFLKDTLTGEYFARYMEGDRIRERRVAKDTSSVVGTAATTGSKGFGWESLAPGERYYIVADPMATLDEVVGVVELVNGIANEPIDEARLRIFYVLVRKVMKRLLRLQKKQVRSTPYDYLVEAGLASTHKIQKARSQANKEGRSVESVLESEHKIAKTDIGQSLSNHFNVPFVDAPSRLGLQDDLLGKFPADFLRTNSVLPVKWNGDYIEIVVVNPKNLTLHDDLIRMLGTSKLTVHVAIKEDIQEALVKILGDAPPPPTQENPLADLTDEIVPEKTRAVPGSAPEWKQEREAKPEIDLAEEPGVTDSAAIRVVNEVIQAAINEGVSDIHFEPTRKGGILCRFRVDGICHDHRSFGPGSARPIVSRIKIMAELDIAEHRLPQDGKIRLKEKAGRSVDLRVAVVPTYAGYEDLVLRLLPESDVIDLDQLKFLPHTLTRFKEIIKQPHGIILCVGPTGSGKTTTLHAALGHRKGPGVKVWTAEDPVEVTQEGIRQVQMNTKIGLTFAHALRAFLRSDPDVIMVGEIRDKETAQAAIEASLTGHLVFSTLHTNSAPETVTRLLEMGLDPFTFADSLLGVLAQRLVRTICSDCKEKYVPKSEELKDIKRHFGTKTEFDKLKVTQRTLKLSRGKGCSKCFNTGYRGRLGLHELLVVNPEVRKMIQQREQADKIRAVAIKQGMTLLRQDGIQKVLMHLTDLNEVLAHTVS